ncbi:MAG: Substrate-specific component PanT of predicted pantothenate ECF transporter [uncultured Rubrobacteraceae bacterium]|uniref:Substrate-specific component PanT of predicted pantothenate ECF transporter n=1 Tax=uncultured Rubrobacteraceae bacterium TaxID=349277 RepID=A0A6J4QPU4_9ACTN|nr:MAG: Substrate-specific component PanT of predicted pantothenate ECF transporter [uncultured Rubrobacteraceae bacterium]
MTTGSGSESRGSVLGLSVRQIVIAGILGGIAIFLGATRLGFIPVPNLAGNATILHVPVILGGALEGPVVGTIVGLIFGVFSFIQAEVPFFRNPLVSILPRLVIGVVAWAVFVGLRNVSLDLASAAAGVLGSLTNTVGVIGMAVLLGYLPLAAVVPIVPQALVEAVLAAVVTVVVVRGVLLVRSGRTTAAETDAGEERRY